MIELADSKKHLIVKRDGTIEPFNVDKLTKVLLWACDDNEHLVKNILDAIDIKIYNRMDIRTLYDEVMDTVDNMTTRLTPIYNEVYKKLYIQKTYKEYHGIKRSEYPDYYTKVLKPLIDNDVIIDITNNFTQEEINTIANMIIPERDFNSTAIGLQTFFKKNSKKVNNKPIELLQHGFMRLAIQAYIHEPNKKLRLKFIQKRYDDLSTFVYTEATPKWLNSLTFNFQAASCCLHQMDDSIESINTTINNIGQYSKYGGGNAVDVSSLRAKGSTIGTNGVSSGPIPFIKMTEASINAYNQLGSRPGACVVTTNWWHQDIKQILELKDEGGVEADRARNLQYSIKINRLFLNRIKKDKDISLFDPKLVPDLLTTYGKEFEDLYTKYENNPTIPRTTIPARDLAYLIAKIRVETGNLYIFFTENANESTPFKQLITQSNLCTEIFLPTTAANPKTTKIVTDMTTSEITTIEESETGLLALCNLSSINIARWMSMSNKQRYASAYNLLRASDNLIDYQYYPVKDGEHFNRNYRAIGIGMNNLAYYFAKNNIKFSEPKALLEMEKISKSIKDIFTQASEDLALERGNFPYYHKTNLTRPARFATLFAIAPTASSALVIGATEGIEPVNKILVEKTGTYSAKQLAPEAQKLWNNYELAFDIPTKALYDLAVIRQKILLDQGQSINTYITNTNSAYEIINDIVYAEYIGLKSLYYLQSKNTEIEEGCDSCGS